MSRTTFSGPVASTNGFEAPTFTSTTLPYFTTGNIIYVSDLNTLAFGGVDQWYRQDTSAGIGTGGNVGPVGTTYTQGVDYSGSGLAFGQSGPTYVIQLNEPQWNTTGYQTIMAKPIGTPFTFVDQQFGQTVTGTLTSTFSGGAGYYTAEIAVNGSPNPPMGTDQITTITI